MRLSYIQKPHPRHIAAHSMMEMTAMPQLPVISAPCIVLKRTDNAAVMAMASALSPKQMLNMRGARLQVQSLEPRRLSRQ